MRIAILNFTGNRSNWGSQATSHELLRDLAACAPCQPEFLTVPLKKSGVSDRFVEVFFRRAIRKAMLQKRDPGWGGRIAARCLYGRQLNALQSADLVVFQPEGTMDGLKFTTAERLLLLPFLAKTTWQKPVWALNGSAESLVPEFEPVVQSVFSMFDRVAMREPRSAEFLHRLGVKGVTVLPDAAFQVRPEPFTLPFEGPYVCLTGSAILRRHDWRAYAETVIAFAKERGWKVVMLLSGPADVKTLGAGADWGPGVFVLPRETRYAQVAAVLAGAHMLVGGRYHMSVMAAAMGTPFIPMPSGSHKTEGLNDLLGWPVPVVAFDDLPGLLAQMHRVVEQRPALELSTTAVPALRREGLERVRNWFSGP